MQQFVNPHSLRNEILNLLSSVQLATNENVKLLEYTINLFKENGLGSDYYGYHNIDHELEVTYITLMSSIKSYYENKLSLDDVRYLFAAALLHDFDPAKSSDRPHEQNVIDFINKDDTIQKLLSDTNTDLDLIRALILRTTYPWIGEIRSSAEKIILEYLISSSITKDNKEKQNHFMTLGHFLSVSDRVGGYALGNFSKAMDMAKMNAHSSGWHSKLIARKSVSFFEDMLNNESSMCEMVLNGLSKHLRKNFLDNILGFMKLRQEEIQIYNKLTYDGLQLIPTIEKNRTDEEFIKILLEIYKELPKPLQFSREGFVQSIHDNDTILNTLRIGNAKGQIIGFGKGGSLEKYNFELDIEDQNYGKNNTVFFEPVAIKNGYWGFHGGREIRHLFMMQVQSMNFKYMTSFAMRDVINYRIKRERNIEFVKKFNPEHWDYYRVTL